MRAYLTMLPRLQAEEQLAAVRTAALGAGTYPAEDRDRVLKKLDQTAAGGPPRRARKARPRDLAAMGIGMVPPPPEAAPEIVPETASQKGVSDV